MGLSQLGAGADGLHSSRTTASEENDASALHLYWPNLCRIAFGALAGIFAAYCISFMHVSFPGQLAKSRAMGIVSIDILNNHSETEDIVHYLSVIGLPIIGGVGAWWYWARTRMGKINQLYASLEGNDIFVRKNGLITFLVLISAYLYLFFDINFLYAPNDGWQLYGEEGETLACVQRILLGDVYGKDFACIYGPLLIYPLALCMKVFGTTIAVQRGYTFFLNLLSHSIIIFLLWREIRNKYVFMASCLVYFTIFYMMLFPSLNTTYIRVGLGILSIELYSLYLNNKNRYLLIILGVVEGISLLLSQEVAICSMLSIAVMLCIDAYKNHSFYEIWKDVGLICAGIIFIVLPVMAYFIANKAFWPAMHMVLLYPKLFSLGFNCLPFDDFSTFFSNPLKEKTLMSYWVICVYIVSALVLVPMLLSKYINRKIILRCGILLFGIILYRSALGRFDQYHVLYVSPPAVLLCMFLVDDLIHQNGIKYNATRIVFVVAILFSSLPLLRLTKAGDGLSHVQRNIRIPLSSRLNKVAYGELVPESARGGIYYTHDQADAIRKIGNFLADHTSRSDYVYFFPNEAAFYFLFDRKEPTKYNVSYLAATYEQRQDLINDLEDKKPQYVVYSLDTWRVDNIAEDVQEPEVVQYLTRHYKLHQNLGNILILKRSGMI